MSIRHETVTGIQCLMEVAFLLLAYNIPVLAVMMTSGYGNLYKSFALGVECMF